MFERGSRKGSAIRLDSTALEGWAIYRQAVVALGQNDWARAMERLAAAETSFSALDDFQGLWRALIGQALLHWRECAPSLALARAMAALRAAEAADDGFAVGCVAWQIANMLLGQGDYRRAAELLDQAQLGLDSVGIAPADGALAVAGQLCAEIIRWQQLCERQQIGQREAEVVIADIQRDLLARLHQAATSVRMAPAAAATVAAEDSIFLLPEPPGLLALPDSAGQPGWNGRLARLWRRLVRSDDTTQVEDLKLVSATTLLPTELLVTPAHEREADESPAEAPAELAAEAPEPPAEPTAAQALTAPAGPAEGRARTAPSGGLAVYCFGTCRVYWNDELIERWESARGRLIFKYLVTHRATATSKEALAELFWPDSEAELARRSLHQAIYCLRQTFKHYAPETRIITFAQDHYQIEPELSIWVDAAAFSQAIGQARAHYSASNIEAAMHQYTLGLDLYSAPFLSEDRYESWTEEPRRTYQSMYLEALHRLARYHFEREDHAMVIMLCQRALADESCDEDSHQLLIASYMAQGLRHLAVRQFQICTSTLKSELGLAPSEELTAFFRKVVGG